MPFTLSMSGVIVGRSELEERNGERRFARGVFRPGVGYELAQPIFDLYADAGADRDALGRYRRARDALRLRLVDGAGSEVSVRDIHIVRRPDGTAPPSYELQIETDDPAFWAG